MKQLTCELCGSSDLIKQEGVYVCQSCGTKYSVEDAKKMMIDVSGTVKIDDSEKFKKLYELARISFKNGNYESAEKHYDSILQNEPTNWEALFYNAYSSAMKTNIANISNAAYKVTNVFDSVLSNVKKIPDKKERLNVIREIYDKSKEISLILSISAQNFYNDIDISIRSSHKKDTVDRIKASCNILFSFGDCLVSNFPQNLATNRIAQDAWHLGHDGLSPAQKIDILDESQLISLKLKYTKKGLDLLKENIDLASESAKKFWEKYPNENDEVFKQMNNLKHVLLPSAKEINNAIEVESINERIKLLNDMWRKSREEEEVLSDSEKADIYNEKWEANRLEQHEKFVEIRDNRLRELKEIKNSIEENENLIKNNQKLFGEQAKIRKSAQEAIIDLKNRMKDYGDLL